MVIQLPQLPRKTKISACRRRARDFPSTMARQHQLLNHQSNHTRPTVINHNITPHPNHGSTRRSEISPSYWGELTANLNKHALKGHSIGCVSQHPNLVLMRPYPLCDYLALQACAYRISVHERLPANFINCVTALEKGNGKSASREDTPCPPD